MELSCITPFDLTIGAIEYDLGHTQHPVNNKHNRSFIHQGLYDIYILCITLLSTTSLLSKF